MVVRHSKHHETIQRGQALYESAIRSRVESQHHGRFLVMDVNSGEFEIDDNLLIAVDRLRARLPNAEVYTVRVGHPTAFTLGGSRISNS